MSEQIGKGKQTLFTRNFTLLILGQLFSLMGNGGLKFALSMYVLEETGSAAVFGTLLAVSMVPTILLTPFGGILADRANRRTIMVCLDLISGLSVLTAALAFGEGRGLAATTVLLIVLSVLGAFESPTVQACVPQMLSGENLLRGNAAVNQVAAMTGLVSPFLGSILYTAFGVRLVLAGAGVCFLLTALLECFIRLPGPKVGERQSVGAILREDLLGSARFLAQERREVLELLLFAALVSFFIIGAAVVGLPYLIRRELGLSAQVYGVVESAMGLAAILGGLSVGLLADRLPMKRLNRLVVAVGVSAALAGAALALPVGVLEKCWMLSACFFAGQAGVSAFSIFAVSAIQQRTPEHMTGKVMACVATISMCAQPLGQLVYGLLFDAAAGGAHLVLLATGAVLCVLGAGAGRMFSRW